MHNSLKVIVLKLYQFSIVYPNGISSSIISAAKGEDTVSDRRNLILYIILLSILLAVVTLILVIVITVSLLAHVTVKEKRKYGEDTVMASKPFPPPPPTLIL